MKERIPKEDFEQARLVTWLRKQGIKFYAVPNGGKRTFTEAVKFKRLGVSAGVPDLCIPIPIPSKCLAGLYIELKRVLGGVVSDSQKEWLEYLNLVGYRAMVANGFDEAKKIVTDYLAEMPPAA